MPRAAPKIFASCVVQQYIVKPGSAGGRQSRDTNQIADAYLIGLAVSKDGVVATLDRGMLSLAGKNLDRVEWLRPAGAA